MRIFIAAVTAAVASVLLAQSANAQAIIDGSAAGIDAGMVKSAMATATKEMRDPTSAQFKDIRLIHTSETRPQVICGYVNAKNGYGGYVGFKPFYYEVKRNIGGVVQDSSDKLQQLPLEWSGCAGK